MILNTSMDISGLDMDSTKELFVVQRCWHSGPQQYQSLDLHRLFWSQRDAEEGAYHSAHAWCRYHNPQAEPQVKTLLLPSYPAHNKSGSSYGFIAQGSLFWVRSLVATMVGGNNNSPVFAPSQEAYAVITEGVIGGTGNRNSRRGTEVSHGRVFIGHAESARIKALETCHHVMAQLGSHHISTNVAVVPIGKPTEYTSGEFLKDWPPQVLNPHLLQTSMNNDHKRRGEEMFSTTNGFYPTTTTHGTNGHLHPFFSIEGAQEVECPFEVPAAKRRRYFSMNDQTSTTTTTAMSISLPNDDIMMNYGTAGEQA